ADASGVGRPSHSIAGSLLVFQRPLVLGAFNDAQVVQDRVELRTFTGPDEVWNRNRRQQSDDGNHDHDFYERESGLFVGSNLHIYRPFYLFVRWQAPCDLREMWVSIMA